jgi:hypothetical protein
MITQLALALLTFSGSPSAPAPAASGVVFRDTNGDGVRQQGEPGLAGVMVTNGVDVVLTDDAGRYRVDLPDPTDTIISVVQPKGYTAPVDRLNIPRHYYIHKPEGSPDDTFVYKGVEPTGPLPGSVDFALRPTDAPESFEVLLVGDPQPYTDQEVSWYGRDVITELHRTPAAFAFALGDLVGDDLSLFEPYNEMNALSGHIWRNVYGNHDMNFMSPNDQHADETYNRAFGPTDYAFFHGSTLFIVLDNVQWNGFIGLRADGRPKNNNYIGAVSDNQVQFVANLLKHTPQDSLVVLATHIPLIGANEREATKNLDSLLAALSSHPRTLSVSGHTHIQQHFYLGSEHGYVNSEGVEHHHYNVATASGTWWRGSQDERGIPHTMMRDGAPNGYGILSVRGNEYTVRYKAAGHPDSYQMNIHAPDMATGGEAFTVNVFNGSPRSKVEFRMGNDDSWTSMTHAPQIDPGYARLVESDKAAQRGKTLNEPAVSSHIWAANLPAELPEGTSWLEVRCTDAFGQVTSARFPVRKQGKP